MPHHKELLIPRLRVALLPLEDFVFYFTQNGFELFWVEHNEPFRPSYQAILTPAPELLPRTHRDKKALTQILDALKNKLPHLRPRPVIPPLRMHRYHHLIRKSDL